MNLIHFPIFDKHGGVSSARLRSYGQDKLFEQVKQSNLSSTDVIEHLYWYTHCLTDYPKQCLYCGTKITIFANLKIGYRLDYCSNSCVHLCKAIKLKKQATMLLNFGEHVTNAFQLSDTKVKKIATCQLNHGVDWPTQSQNVRDKVKNSYLNRYGVDNPNKDASCLAARLETYSLNHWSKVFSNQPQFSKLTWNTELNTSTVIYNDSKMTAEEARVSFEYDQLKLTGDEKPKSSLEVQIIKLIRAIDPTIILLSSDRKLIKPFELDILIPAQKLAIEINGTYWHNTTRLPSHYHRMKTTLTANEGYKLLHIFEHDIDESKLSSLLRVKLGKAIKLMARKCMLITLTQLEATQFHKMHHRQGSAHGKLSYGLSYLNELVQVITIDVDSNELMISRLTSKTNTVIVGGISKLLHKCKLNFSLQKYTKLIVKTQLSEGSSSFRTVGFNFSHKTAPTSKQVKMVNNELYEVYDCGSEVFEMSI